MGIRSSIGCPITVAGQLWGVIAASTKRDEPFPTGTESQIARFTELVATAVESAEAREELRRIAEEQAALRRVATLVAGGAEPAAVFEPVTEEISTLFHADATALIRFESNGVATFLGGRGWSCNACRERGSNRLPALLASRAPFSGGGVCRTWKLWGSRGYVGWSCRRSASSQDLLFLRGVDQSTAHQSWEFVLHNDRCQITCQSAPEVSRAQAPPAFDQNDIWQLVTQVPGCLIGGPARRGAVITCPCAAT